MQSKIKILILTSLLSSTCLSMNVYAICNNLVEATTDHLVVSDDGLTVYDSKTKLTWQRCSIGQNWDGTICDGTATQVTWQDAFPAVGSGWRLPNIKELASIVEQQCIEPAINETAFPNTYFPATPSSYWSSSSTGLLFTDRAWSISFFNGDDKNYDKRTPDLYVRLVRSGSLVQNE